MIGANGISTSSGVSMTWAEIVAVSAYKIDAITKSLTYLTFNHECGEYLEITNEDPEFQIIIDSLDDYIDLPYGWKYRIETAIPDDGIFELWKKEEG